MILKALLSILHSGTKLESGQLFDSEAIAMSEDQIKHLIEAKAICRCDEPLPSTPQKEQEQGQVIDPVSEKQEEPKKQRKKKGE